jgi:alpha-amylase/alpha-mannosidase (GH57 family)
VKVCILWHMHQPDYRLPGRGGRAAMPWVRLHAAKDYMDMARLAEEAPENVKTTFNLTPCLLEQLASLAEGHHEDEFLDVARKDAKDLSEPERLFVLQHFFSANEARQIRPLPRYAELRDRKERARGKLLERFSDADLRDLVVLFHLAWSGQWLRRESAVQHLLAKGRGFSEDDRRTILEAQDAQAKKIFPLYGQLARAGKIEVSTTPLYHPILPLLVDLRTATEARPGCSVGGVDFRYPGDARRHVDEGLARTERHLGWRPKGMWPSEGSLSEAALRVIADAGITWCATDEQNLKKSLRASPPACHLRPWRVRGEGPAIFFRDTGLSDLIGFTYQSWPDADRAAEDFVARCMATGRVYPGPGEAILPIILDGENAWEFYAENGEIFLRSLYQMLGATSGLEATTFSRALEKAEPGNLSQLAPGSWIYGNFDTWAGHEEKNRAWSLLTGVRREVEDAGGIDAMPADAREVLLRAEGSDWFWWLGDDHPTAYLSEFESLFRQNLRYVCQRLGRRPPSNLDEPIPRRRALPAAIEEPMALISPRVDGEAVRYYEWLGSGAYRPENEGAAMKVGSEPLVSEMRFGFDERNLYLRFDTRKKSPDLLRRSRVRLRFEAKDEASVFDWSEEKGLSLQGNDLPQGAEAACVRVLEVAIPRGTIGLHVGSRARLSIEITSQDDRRELLPRDGAIELIGPDEHFDLRNWTL